MAGMVVQTFIFTFAKGEVMRRTLILSATLAVLAIFVMGCADGPASPSGDPSVIVSASFSKSAASAGLFKTSDSMGLDSLRIDSAVVVFQRIKFESHVDTVKVDSSENSDDDSREEETNITLKGPFVVHIRDTVAIDFASQILPAGTYDGIKFKIHRLNRGEPYEDSDEHGGRHRMSVDSLPYGSSVTVWGVVKKNGAWTPFRYAFDGELEFKVKGSFTISEGTSFVRFALNVNMGVWFTTPGGSLLDPTDPSSRTRGLIRESIKRSFSQCRGGRDWNHDGHPDD
jgi:hypothetical protein